MCCNTQRATQRTEFDQWRTMSPVNQNISRMKLRKNQESGTIDLQEV